MTTDLDIDPRLEDRLRRTLAAVAEQTPLHSELVLAPSAPSARAPRRVLVVLASAAAVLLGALIVADGRDEVATVRPAERPAPDGPAATNTTVSGRPGDADHISAVAVAWRQLASDALGDPAWRTAVPDADIYRHVGPTGSTTLVATVGDPSDPTLSIDVQAFAAGEYRDDPVWRQEVAGASGPGRLVEEGELFVVDEPARDVRSAVVVTERGVVLVHSTRATIAGLPSVEAFADLARLLAREAPRLLDPA